MNTSTNTIGGGLSFPTLGGRSPVLRTATSHLKRGYYYANAFILLVLLLSFGIVKYKEWRVEQQAKGSVGGTSKRVVITYAQLGPPPSLTGEEAGTPQASAGRPTAPAIGVPKPVPDDQAVVETSEDQATISGTTIGPASGGGTIEVVDQSIPDINAFVPYETAPEAVFSPAIKYPEAARRLGAEGTVYIKGLIDLDGSVMKVVVMRSSGFDLLDTVAVENASKWKFTPALQNKNPVRVWIMLPIRFVLSEH